MLLTFVGCVDGDGGVEVTVVAPHELAELSGPVALVDVAEVVSSRHGVWVLDRAPPYVTLLPADDAAEAVRFGARGDGPFELEAPVALHPSWAGVDVWDPASAKRVFFGHSGALISVERLADDRSGRVRRDIGAVSHLDPWRVRRLGDGVAYAHFPDGLVRPADFAGGVLVAARRDLGDRRTLLAFSELMTEDRRGFGPFPAVPLWDVCNDRIVVWEPGSARVVWRDAVGRPLGAVAVPSEATPIDFEDIVSYLRLMARHELGPQEIPNEAIRRRAREVEPEFGSSGPAYADLRCGVEDAVWLQRFDLADDPLGHGATWLEVTPHGPRDEVRFPPGFRPYLFEPDGVLGVERTGRGDVVSEWRPESDAAPPTSH